MNHLYFVIAFITAFAKRGFLLALVPLIGAEALLALPVSL